MSTRIEDILDKLQARNAMLNNDAFHCTMGFLTPLSEQIDKALNFERAIYLVALLLLQKSQCELPRPSPGNLPLMNPFFFKTPHETFLINKRHNNQQIQEEYDNRFGLVPYAS